MSCIACDAGLPIVKKYQICAKNRKGEKVMFLANQEIYAWYLQAKEKDPKTELIIEEHE